MKALMIKDLRLVMRQQRATLFMFIAIILLVIGATENPMFGIMYTVFLLPALLISTISYDTFENGMLFLLALPISKRDYVAEKYLLTVGDSVIVNILATGLTYLTRTFKGGTVDITEFLVYAFSAQSIILLYTALALPVNIRYGTEKGRFVIIILAIAIGALLGSSGHLPETGGTNALEVFGIISQFGIVELLLLVLLVCVLLTVVSFLVCVKWVKKKEY